MAGAVRRAAALATSTLALTLAPAPADASNENLPRQVAVWSDAPCMQVVDRSKTPVVHFEYTHAMEDAPAMLTEDEVSDSRRLQFFAFARQLYEPDVLQMQYITWADIERAALVDPQVKPDEIDPELVLETTSRWSPDDWVRVTPDDMRVPITHAQAAMGVDWDVSDVRPGTWIVKSYTWEPTLNKWNARWNGVKVIASEAEADEAGPSVILQFDSAIAETGIAYVPVGCIDAPFGSTLRLEYGTIEGSLEPDWVVAADDVCVVSGPITTAIVLPEDVAQGAVFVRATITDPDGRTYVAISPKAVGVVRGPAEGTSGAGDDATAVDCHDDSQGCGCVTGRGGAAALVVLPFGLRRRRARATLRS